MPVTVYVNNERLDSIGYRALVKEPKEFDHIWETSNVSQEEAIGKLILKLSKLK